MLKMYVVVREDMTPAQQAVQTSHALADYAAQNPLPFRKWNEGNNTLVVLAVPDERALKGLQVQLEDGEIPHAIFEEPDPVGLPPTLTSEGTAKRNTKTALAVGPNWTAQNILLKDLPLALRRLGWSRRQTWDALRLTLFIAGWAYVFGHMAGVWSI